MATIPSPGVTLEALGLIQANLNLTFVQRLKFEELRAPRSLEDIIDRCIRYYEASNNRFFLGRIGNLLKDFNNGKLEAMGYVDDVEEDDLLCIIFALGDGPLTKEEAKKVSSLILGDDKFQAAFVENSSSEVPREMALQAYGSNVVSELKDALLELCPKPFLHPNNVLDFLGLACPMGRHVGFHKATIEALKAIEKQTPTIAKTKISLTTPELQLQLKVQKAIVRTFEAHLRKLRKGAQYNVGDTSSLGLREAFLALDLLNRDVGEVKVELGLGHFETDIEELEALGIKEA